VDSPAIKESGRYRCLGETLRHAIEDRRDLPNGYALQMDTSQMGTEQLVEWVEVERQCRPFLGFEARKNGSVCVHLDGPEGVKESS
jgi:hypothetical protein